MRNLAVLICCLVAASAEAQRPRVQPGPSTVDGRAHEGAELTVDLPQRLQMENIGSKLGNHAGMCVFTAIEMGATWQGLEQMHGFRDWCAATYEGGGDPENVIEHIDAWCKHKGIKAPPYHQYMGPDPGPILDRLDATGRMGCITYGQSPRYADGRNPTGTVAHMVNCVACQGKWGVVLDNNFCAPKHPDAYEWMDRAELVRRMKHPRGQAWVFWWDSPGPPPVPK